MGRREGLCRTTGFHAIRHGRLTPHTYPTHTAVMEALSELLYSNSSLDSKAVRTGGDVARAMQCMHL